MKAHPTAQISPEANIAEDVEIGPFSLIEGPVTLAAGCRVASHVILQGDVRVGEGTRIGAGSIIGADPQSVGFDESIRSGVEIGCRNQIREYVTIHRSLYEGQSTKLGDENFLMTGAHLGHDVIAGNHNVIANNCLLAGHVMIGNRCFLGGGTVYHQFMRIGDYVIVRGLSALGLDIPPFVIAAGVNRIAGLNVVGLRRGGFSSEDRAAIKRAFDLIYRGGMNLSQALAEADRQSSWEGPAGQFIDFFREKSRRGYCLQRFGREPEDQ
ncbi:MAG: acyl-ACP--UDP-N-acetylglucosamine O-acyltransferase [Verrucomicrobiae bacterium]|nr:acyl-ACP--UDP-N-acetylglucosamine O-acyltransferase [Verrucomicrobiae bacterium]